MSRPLSAAQRRAVTGSDPATGRLSARAEVCVALAAAGLAVPHGRGGHHSYYLTTEGLRLRAELEPVAGPIAGSAAGSAAGPAAGPPPEPVPPVARPHVPGGAFTADSGMGPGAAAPGGPRRAAEVAAAWEGLLQIRAVLLDGVTDVPAPWERERQVHAVALALEAAGCPPARRPDGDAAPGDATEDGPGGGYTVTGSAQDGMAEVSWRGAAGPAQAERALARCAGLLDERGWQCTRHRDRGGVPFLLASPRRGR